METACQKDKILIDNKNGDYLDNKNEMVAVTNGLSDVWWRPR